MPIRDHSSCIFWDVILSIHKRFRYYCLFCVLLLICLKPFALLCCYFPVFESSLSASYVFPFFVPKLDHVADYKSTTAKIFAFYLPQFHTFPENDKFWGEGFTEWSNVKSARPLFRGHYQPHKPIELGYYNLKNFTVMLEQIKLAKKYGINGFVFYFYWFNGKILMEKPIQMFAESHNNDHSFCLCWANENWTRTWDGQSNNILLEQKYSENDDIKFIMHISYYMMKKNYIRVNNLPLVLIYAPNQMPNPAKTFLTWRKWCRENDIGEIYIAKVNGHDISHPELYGIDAAIDFPPNQFKAEPIVIKEVHRECLFVWDYASLNKQSRRHFKVFSGVTPAWDNTPRRKKCGAVYANSAPYLYQKWLYDELVFTSKNFQKDERLIFVNAWNEWGEGAHLEPDERHGYGYLEATRMALVQHDLTNRANKHVKKAISNVAFFIHVYYVDIFAEILKYILEIKKYTKLKIKLYIAVYSEIEQRIYTQLHKYSFKYVVKVVNNRGRDILPFLLMLPQLTKNNDLIVKLHTKKSFHRKSQHQPYGNLWSKWLLKSLISYDSFKETIENFENNAKLGIKYPKGSVVPVRQIIGSNTILFSQLAMRLGYDPQTALRNTFFSTENMFIARTDALLPLENLAFDNYSFEYELGKTDGSLAYAFERVIGLSIEKSGYIYSD